MPRKPISQEEKLVKHQALRKYGPASLYAPLTSFCNRLGLREGDIVTIELEGERIIITKFKG